MDQGRRGGKFSIIAGFCWTQEVVKPELSVLVSMEDWRLLSDSSLLVDSSLSTYNVIHVSRDIATDQEKTRNWCLHGNHRQHQ